MEQHTPKHIIENENQLIIKLAARITDQILSLEQRFLAEPQIYPTDITTEKPEWQHQPVAPSWEHPYSKTYYGLLEEARISEIQEQKKMAQKDYEDEKEIREEELFRSPTIVPISDIARGIYNKLTENRITTTNPSRESRQYYPETRYTISCRLIKVRNIEPYGTIINNIQRLEDVMKEHFAVENRTPPPGYLDPFLLLLHARIPEEVKIDQKYIQDFVNGLKRRALITLANGLNVLLEKRINEIERYPIQDSTTPEGGSSTRA